MNDLISLDALADAINHEHTEVERALTAAVGHAIKAGELLLQAKANVAHGEWLPWLKAHCRVSDRTARGYMRMARELPKLDEEKRQRVANLPLREALQALAEPKEPEPDREKCPGGWLDATPEARRNAMLTWPQDRMQYTLLLEAYGHSPGEIAEILNVDEGLITPILNPEPPDRYLGGFDFGDAQNEFEKGYRLAVKSQISGMLAVSYKDASFHARLDGRNDVYSMLELLAKRNSRHSQEYLDTAYGVLGCFQEEWIYVFFIMCAVTDARIALGIDRTETGREALWMMLGRYEKDAKQAVKMSRKHT